MDSKLRKIEKILIFLPVLLFHSCWCLDYEVSKEYSLNSEYKISYLKYPNREIDGVDLLTQDNEGVFVVHWLAYNNNYIYFKNTIGRAFYYQLKINLKSKEIGDRKIKKLSKEEFDDLVSKCKDCIILDMETLNLMDKDIPPLPPSD